MENEKEPGVLESLFDRAADYVETRADLARLKATRKASEIISGMVSRLIVLLIFSFFLMVLNIGLGLWLGELMHKIYLGFFALAGFYLIVGIIIYSCRNKWLKVPVANAIIKKIHS